MRDPRIRALVRRTMLAGGWGYATLAALSLLSWAHSPGPVRRMPAVAAVFLLMALKSFRLSRELRTDAYWRVFQHA